MKKFRSTLAVLLVALMQLPSATGTALFKHKVAIRTCNQQQAKGVVRMWEEPWVEASEKEGGFDDTWDSYYGGSLTKIGHGKVWTKTWTSEMDLFDVNNLLDNSNNNSSSRHNDHYMFEDLVLGGEEDEICISDILAETEQENGEFKVRWRFQEQFWLAGYGSVYYKSRAVDWTPCYTEMHVGGCAVTFVRVRKNGGVDHLKKEIGCTGTDCDLPCPVAAVAKDGPPKKPRKTAPKLPKEEGEIFSNDNLRSKRGLRATSGSQQS